MIDRSRRLAAGRKVPPLDRRPIAGTGDRQGSGRRSEIDPQHGLGQPKSLPHFMGRASPAIAATGGGSNGLALILRDQRSAKPPPVAAQTIVEPATLARTTQALRPARPRSGTTPRRFAVDKHFLLSTPVPCVRAGGTTNMERLSSTSADSDRIAMSNGPCYLFGARPPLLHNCRSMQMS